MGIIYLIQLREFVNADKNIYKIGRSVRDGVERIKEYPKNSKLYYLTHVSNNTTVVKIETTIIKKFKKIFIHRSDIGNEYFEGDHIKMINYIHEIIIFYKKFIKYTEAINILCEFNKLIRDNPCNRNVIINDTGIKVYINDKWEEYYLEEVIKNTSKTIINYLDKNEIKSDYFEYFELIAEHGFSIFENNIDTQIFQNSFIESFTCLE